MNSYLPTDPQVVPLLLGVLAGVVALGFCITRLPARWGRPAAWLLALSAGLAAERLTAREPPGIRMLAIVAALLLALKSVVSVEEQAAGRARLTPLRWLLFAIGWLGMRPAAFRGSARRPLPGSLRLLVRGAVCLALGTLVLVAARSVWLGDAGLAGGPYSQLVATALLFIGLSLVVHFGVINILAGLWRWLGIDCQPLFRAPLRARSLAEFWGRRWNLAFVEMATLAVFRPLRDRLGVPLATFVVFLFSGLLHELAISVPVRAGFGLPMLYFAVHGVGVLVEQQLARWGLALERSGWLGRLWTAAWLLLPLPLLFHPPFVVACFWPLAGVGS